MVLKHPEYAHGISDAELIKEAIEFCDEELDGFEGMDYDSDSEVCCQRSNTFIRELVVRLTAALSSRPAQEAVDRAAEKIKLWFFRDLSDNQRRGLFSLFGMPTEQLDTHGMQSIALRRVLTALTPAQPLPVQEAFAFHVKVAGWGEELLFTEDGAKRLLTRLRRTKGWDTEEATISPLYRHPAPSSAGVVGEWRPIAEADKGIAYFWHADDMAIGNSYPIWVRDEDGRVYEALWSDNGTKSYWWDIEGESPVDPVEFMPHPLAAAPQPKQEGE